MEFALLLLVLARSQIVWYDAEDTLDAASVGPPLVQVTSDDLVVLLVLLGLLVDARVSYEVRDQLVIRCFGNIRLCLLQTLHELPFNTRNIVSEVSLLEEFDRYALLNQVIFAEVLYSSSIAGYLHYELVQCDVAVDQFEHDSSVVALAK